MAIDKSKRPESFYEVLPEMRNESHDDVLVASFTPNNGIRIGIINGDCDDGNWREFDFYDLDQAEAVGQALIRWAQRCRAEHEMYRVWARVDSTT